MVDVQSCSLTRGDIGFIDDKWGGSPFPLVPGLEIIGTIRDANGTGRQVGEVVGVGYQVDACFACEYCQAGHEQFCRQQKVIPLHAPGGMGDTLVVNERFAFALPQGLQGPEATPLLCAGLTVFSLLQRVSVQPGMDVCVVGIGSLGHLAVKFLHALGCRVSVQTGRGDRLAKLREFGVDNVLDAAEPLPELAYDAVIVTSSGEADWPAYVRALKPDGALGVVGLPSNPITVPADALADFAARRIQGGYIGSRADMTGMLEFAAEHHITAEVAAYPMADIDHAVEDMRRRRVPFSTVLVS